MRSPTRISYRIICRGGDSWPKGVSSVEPEKYANQQDRDEECAGELAVAPGYGSEMFEGC